VLGKRKLQYSQKAHDLEDWFAQAVTNEDKKALILVILNFWCIWKQRNAIIFRPGLQEDSTGTILRNKR